MNPPLRVLRRSSDDRLVAGVAAGVAGHLGVSVVGVRVVFVLLAGLSGVGVLLYTALWAVLPQPPDPHVARRGGAIMTGAAMTAYGILGLCAAVVFNLADGDPRSIDASTWPAIAVAAGAGVIRHLSGAAFVIRLVVGGSLVAAGVIGGGAEVGGALLLLGALAAVGAWRARTQAGAERAARLHERRRAEALTIQNDHALQTLALIYRNAGDDQAIRRLTDHQAYPPR